MSSDTIVDIVKSFARAKSFFNARAFLTFMT